MIPLRDENPTRTTAYVVYGIIALNVILFLYNGTLRAGGGNPLAGLELVPARLTAGYAVGALSPVAPWLTIFTSMFLHANLFHIAGNMLYLWIFGNNIEDVLGHFKFLIFYLLAGVGAAMAQVLMDPSSQLPMVGASGAIAGVLGAYLILFPRARIVTLLFLFYYIEVVELPASVILGFWIILQVVSNLLTPAHVGGVAYSAHVGGFVTGVALLMLFGGKRVLGGRRPVQYRGRYDW